MNRKMIPLLIHFMILLANNSGIDSRKNAKNGQGIGILLESKSAQPQLEIRLHGRNRSVGPSVLASARERSMQKLRLQCAVTFP